MQRKFFCSWKEVRNHLRRDQQVMGWQHSFQTKTDMPKIADCCHSEKSGFRSSTWFVRIFYRGKVLKRPKCLSAVLRHLQRRGGGLFPGRVSTSWHSCPEMEGQCGAPVQKAVSCPAVMLLLLTSDVKGRPFWCFCFLFYYWISSSWEREIFWS